MRYLFVVFALIMLVPMPSQAEGLNAEYPLSVTNMNVRTLYNDWQIFIEEVDKSVSRASYGTTNGDATRWKTLIGGMVSYMNYVQGKEVEDWPVTHGRKYVLDTPLYTSCETTDNTPVCDLLDKAINARDELAVSNSATNAPKKFHPADEARQKKYWTSMVEYIDEYLLVNNALDTPISAAEEALGLTPGFDASDAGE